MTQQAGIEGPSPGRGHLDELAHTIDRGLRRLAERECRDTAGLLRSLVAGVASLRDACDREDGAQDANDAPLWTLAELLGRVLRTLSDLDLVARVDHVITEAQATALEADQLVGIEGADTAPLQVITDEDAATGMAALRSLADTLRKDVREPYRDLVAIAVARHAGVASSATRCVHAVRRLASGSRQADPFTHPDSGDPDPGDRAPGDPDSGDLAPGAAISARAEALDGLTELEAALSGLAEWLADGPVEGLRTAIREQLREYASEEPDAQSRRIGPPVRIARPRAPWNRLGHAERLAGEHSRLEFLLRLLAFHAYLDDFVRAELLAEADRVASEAIDRLSTAIADLRESHDEAARTLAAVDAGRASSPDSLLARGLRSLSAAHTALIELAERSEALDAATEGAGALSDEIGRLGDPLSIGPLVESGEDAEADDGLVTVEPKAWAQDAFGVFVLEGLRDKAQPYAAGLRTALELVPSAQTVLEYNLRAAIDLEDDGKGQGHELRSELVLGGLDRTADRLAEALDELEEIRRTAPVSAQLQLDQAADEFWARAVAEDSLEGRARDVWAALSQGAGTAGAWAIRHALRMRDSAKGLLSHGSARALRTLRRARVAVGAEPVAAERVDATVREIADVDTAASDLPFVYRRLFSYRSVTDESLLVGREETAAVLERHRARWQAGVPDALLIVGSSGVGTSSLMEVTRQRWGDEVDWCTIELEERVGDESSLARTLSEALGVQADSLDELQRALEVRPEPERPQVCVLDNFELLYRRDVLDSGLISATLRTMSATDGHVLWIASLAASAWQVLTVLKPGVAAFVRVLALDPLTRTDIEAAILARHQRSGIPLVMDPPAEPPMGVRRALARAKDDDERQALLRAAFFDRLYELSDGYMALAILYWLRALRLDFETETMHIGWPASIDFGAWDDLEASGAFALRAFLEHGSLTLTEYAEVFGVGEEQALATFERLGNLLLIESVGPTRQIGTRLRFRRIEPDLRYRIRPVLVRPVERLLSARRLLY